MADPKTPQDFLRPERDEEVSRIQQFYDDYIIAVTAIFGLIATKKINNIQAKSRIIAASADLEKGTQKWAGEATVEWYKEGLWVGIAGFVNNGKPLKLLGMSDNDRIMTQQMADSIWLDFGKAMQGVRGSALQALSSSTQLKIKEELANQFVGGGTAQKTAEAITNIIGQQGFTALVDRGGRKWDLGNYADMLSKTKRTQTANLGVQTRNLENGNDLVQVSSHGSSHEACARWEGEVLSQTGAAKNYPTVSDAEGDGLFHPNCQHRLYPYHAGISGKPEYEFSSEPEIEKYFTGAGKLLGDKRDFENSGIYGKAFSKAVKKNDQIAVNRIASIAPRKVREQWLS